MEFTFFYGTLIKLDMDVLNSFYIGGQIYVIILLGFSHCLVITFLSSIVYNLVFNFKQMQNMILVMNKSH